MFFINRAIVIRLLCVALVAAVMLPLGNAVFPYVSHALDGTQFQALEAGRCALPCVDAAFWAGAGGLVCEGVPFAGGTELAVCCCAGPVTSSRCDVTP
jgi:hypothetical protein